MYYIPTFSQTKEGLNINRSRLVTEEGAAVLTFNHATPKGYRSNKPLVVDFDYVINTDNEIEVTDEVAALLIDKYKNVTYKVFETQAGKERGRNMAALNAWASVLGDHGDTSGQFSR